VSFLGTLSLVQGQSRAHFGLAGRFAAAFTVSSVTIFGLAGAIGLASAEILPAGVRLAATCVALCAALALDVHALRHRTWCPLTLRRQTPKDILLRHGSRRAAVAWGLDTGLVFTTYRMSAIGWALLALGLLGAVPWWIGIGYAAGFAAPLAAGLLLSPLWTDPHEAPRAGLALARRAQLARAVCVAALAVAVGLAVAALVSS
jgi:hypothetical protein